MPRQNGLNGFSAALLVRQSIALMLAAAAAHAQSTDFATFANPLFGTGGGGLCSRTAALPFGMVQFGPPTFNGNIGFTLNQYNGAGCGVLGNFPVLPVAGALTSSPNTMTGLGTTYNGESVSPGYYFANVKNAVSAELTVTTRVGYARFTFPAGSQGTVLIGSGVSATYVDSASVGIDGATTLHGWAAGGDFCGAHVPYKVYFAAQFDRACASSGTWTGTALTGGSASAAGANSGAYFTFDVSSDRTVQLKVALSYVSSANAALNLAEVGSWNFTTYRDSAHAVWNDYLGRISVSGGSVAADSLFYSALYRALLHPNVFSDVNGQYIGSDNQVHTASGFTYYSGWSGWDIYRSQIQLASLLAPDRVSDMVRSLVLFAQQGGGGIPRWVVANVETGIMVPDAGSDIVCNAYAFGAHTIDKAAALTALRKNAEAPGTVSNNNVQVRGGLSGYLYGGWVGDAPSNTEEFTVADFAIGRFALTTTGDTALYRTYLKRAQNWRNVFDPQTRYLRDRYADGTWGTMDRGWTEGTYDQYYWMVPFNLKGLGDMIGGNAAAVARLDTLFTKTGGSGTGGFNPGNEPDIQVPWAYNWYGAPSKTQAAVRTIMSSSWANSAGGIPGNDDLGTMSAWYVFMAIGMFPEITGVGGFSINGPSYASIVINLGGKTVTINGGSPTSQYIQSVTLNGRPWNRTWLPLDSIVNGATLTFTMGAAPSAWGAADSVVPPSFDYQIWPDVALGKPVTASGSPCSPSEGPSNAVDGNIGDKWCTTLGAGAWLSIDLGKQYTIVEWVLKNAGTMEDSTRNTKDFKLQMSGDGSSWSDVDVVTGNTLTIVDHDLSPVNARYFRLFVTNSGADQAVRIPEIELRGYPSDSSVVRTLGATITAARPAARVCSVSRVAVRLDVPNAGAAALAVYAVNGRLVRMLRLDGLQAGPNTVALGGAGLAAGVYRLRLVGPGGALEAQITAVVK